LSLLKIFSLKERKKNSPRAIALGKFEALHLAHLKIIKQTILFAQKNDLVPAVTSFSETFSFSSSGINTFAEKEKILRTLGIEEIIYFNFSQLADLDYLVYLEEILRDRLKTKFLAFGENHLFGRNRIGNCQVLVSWCQKNKIAYLKQNLEKFKDSFFISSSRIKKLLSLGKLEIVNDLLPQGFSLTGEVQTGIRLAHKLGAATLNFTYPKQKIKVRKGVYCAFASFLENPAQKYKAILNIGKAPTIKSSSKILVEVHLLVQKQFKFKNKLASNKKNLLKVKLLKFLRSEKKFPTKKILINQIKKDILKAKKFFKTYKKHEI